MLCNAGVGRECRFAALSLIIHEVIPSCHGRGPSYFYREDCAELTEKHGELADVHVTDDRIRGRRLSTELLDTRPPMRFQI